MPEHDVIFIEELAEILRCSTDAVYRGLKRSNWRYPPLPDHIDRKLRWSRSIVLATLRGERGRMRGAA